MASKVDIAERFADKWCPEPNTGCWLWTRYSNTHGYGVMRVRPMNILAHRLAWMIHMGDIPSGLYVLHKCDTPACVNPGHLFLGTRNDNMNDMAKKGRSGRAGSPYYAAIKRLTPADIVDMQNSYRFGRYVGLIGDLMLKYGIPRMAVRRIVCGKSVQHGNSHNGI